MRPFFPLLSPPLSSPAGPYAIQGKHVIRIQSKEGTGRNIDWFKKGEGGGKVGGGGRFSFSLSSSASSILHFLTTPPLPIQPGGLNVFVRLLIMGDVCKGKGDVKKESTDTTRDYTAHKTWTCTLHIFYFIFIFNYIHTTENEKGQKNRYIILKKETHLIETQTNK